MTGTGGKMTKSPLQTAQKRRWMGWPESASGPNCWNQQDALTSNRCSAILGGGTHMATDTRSYPVRDVMARAGLAVYTTRLALGVYDLGHRCRRELARSILDRQSPAFARWNAFSAGAVRGHCHPDVALDLCRPESSQPPRRPARSRCCWKRNTASMTTFSSTRSNSSREFAERQRPFVEATIGEGEMGIKSVILRDFGSRRCS